MRDESWISSLWPFVRAELPPAPATVLELGCGRRGGFVPALLADGYEGVGVDPEAPQGEPYRQVRFEHYERSRPVDALLACTSLHHVGDLQDVLRRIEATLAPAGERGVGEWDWERFDGPTAEWCFEQLAAPRDEPTWLHHLRDEWAESGQPWEAFNRGWTTAGHLHSAESMLDRLDTRFRRRSCTRGPYFFPDLAGATEAEEQAAIDAEAIQATGIRYCGRRR